MRRVGDAMRICMLSGHLTLKSPCLGLNFHKMRFEGEYVANALRGRAWEFLMNTEEVSKCIPGIKHVEVLDKNHFNAAVQISMGSIKSVVDFHFEAVNVKEPTHAELRAKGKGSIGEVAFDASMDLTEVDPQRTKIAWSADVRLMGALAGLASRFMQGAASGMTKSFFGCIKAKVEG